MIQYFAQMKFPGLLVALYDPKRCFAGQLRPALHKMGCEIREYRCITKLKEGIHSTPPNILFAGFLGEPTGIPADFATRELVCLGEDVALIYLQQRANVRLAMQAARNGAFDCLSLPFSSALLAETLTRVVEHQNRLARNPDILARLEESSFPDLLAGSSAAMRRVKETIQLLAQAEVTVLIEGESGTGKELVARMLHEGSRRKKGPFVAVNSAALADSMIESELFGHRKGSFTGAFSDKPGRFALANGGTLFLDEIGDLSPKGQADLLRVLEDGMYRPLGSPSMLRADVRIITATHHDLFQACKMGQFREDLLYRLNVVTIHLPPLRDRPEDIEDLSKRFLSHFCAKHGRPLKVLSPDALRILHTASWPGNVRQLRNEIERIVLLCRGSMIGADDVFVGQSSQASSEKSGQGSSFQTLAQLESQHIHRALEYCGGNRTEAAQALGISRRALHYKLRQMAKE